jgi:site-specific recombinase XerD
VSVDVDASRDLAVLRVAVVGRLVLTGDRWSPVVLRDPLGDPVESVGVFLRDLSAQGRAVATLRSYGMDLLRWFRFLWAVGVAWDRATRCEARDFCCWLGATARPGGAAGYSPATRAHAETVLRRFYDLHCESGTGPIVNPFPLARSARGARPNAHHNPMEPFRRERVGAYRPVVPQRVPRCIPDEVFDRLFAALRSHRDRALVALWVSTGARASELLGVCQGDVDPGQQLITVVRKGSRAAQPLPAAPDAFVWLRLYQAQLHGLVASGRRQPVWWTLRTPLRPLAYHGAHRMFARANALLGAQWTLHDLRHTAAHRMVRDPALPLVDVQWVLGHAHLSTTQLYISPTVDEVITSVRAHHERCAQSPAAEPRPAAGYRHDSLDLLFGGGGW